MKLLAIVVLFSGLAFSQDSYSQQFPDAPEAIVKDQAGNWKHDKSQDPPRWYQHTFTKKWVAMAGVTVGMNVADIELTQRCQSSGSCVEGGGDAPRGGQFESRGEMYRNDMIVDGVMVGFSLLLQSQHFPKKAAWIAYMPLFYGAGVHARGVARGLRY